MLYLHVGSHKTGTSSIQNTFFASRDHLRRNGVDYFSHSANHSKPMIWRFSGQRFTHPVSVTDQLSEEDVRRLGARVEDQLRAFLADPDYPTKVISGEELSTLQPADIDGLRSFLAPFGIEVRIIIYLRNYFEYLNSEIQELVKWGWTLEALREAMKKGQAVLPNYRFRVEKFISRFGAENVDIRIFHRDEMQGGDLLLDFCTAIGAAWAYDGLNENTANTAMSQESVRLLSHYNELNPIKMDGRYNIERTELAKNYLIRRGSRKFQVSNEAMLTDYERVVERDAAYVRSLVGEKADRYLLNRPAILAPDDAGYDPGASDREQLMGAFGRAALELEGYKAAFELLEKLLLDKAHGPATFELTRQSLRHIKVDTIVRHLALTLFSAGRLRLAQLTAERAVEINPNSVENRRLLERAHKAMQGQATAVSAASSHTDEREPRAVTGG